MRTRKINEEVLVAEDGVVSVGKRDIESLKGASEFNLRKRIRLCAHSDVNDPLHEMLIVHRKDTYVRPHMHLNKSESFHVIEGSVDVVLFDEEGRVAEVIPMGDYESGREFYYRISGPYYHTLLITSDFLVFHETTSGPFNRKDTIFAPWSPEETDQTAVNKFVRELSQRVKQQVKHGDL